MTFTANPGYYFAEFNDIESNGIRAHRISDPKVTVSGNPTADAEIAVPDAEQFSSVYYQRWNGSAVANADSALTSYGVVDESTTALENGKWYVVSSSVTISDRITVTGTANLILCDGTTLIASEGITVTSGNTLNIYPGSTSSIVAGTGALYAGCQPNGNNLTPSCAGSAAGIGSSGNNDGGTVTIHGGNVTAIGGSGGAGIGSGYCGDGGTVTIYSGMVVATGVSGGAGIGSGGRTVFGWGGSEAGEVTVNGGKVTATGDGGGPQGDGATVTINGGTVVTAAGQGAEGIGSGDGLGARGSLTIGEDLALYGGDTPDLMALVEKDAIHSVTYYERYRYMTAMGAVKGVKTMIDQLPDPDAVTAADKEAIESARKAYDELTAAQKAGVPSDTLKKLTDDEAALKDAIDTAAANEVAGKINALPTAGKVTAADRDAIEAAWAAYDALTDDQKAKVGSDTLKKLTDAEEVLEGVEIEYTAIKDAGSSWAKGSAEGCVFTFKRNVNDFKTIDEFVGLKVDGVEVPHDSYTAVAGSVVITLSPSYLETLSVGKHKLTAMFVDGDDVTVDFEVLEATATKATTSSSGTKSDSAKSGLAKAGDTPPLMAVMATLLLSAAALVVGRRELWATRAASRANEPDKESR